MKKNIVALIVVVAIAAVSLLWYLINAFKEVSKTPDGQDVQTQETQNQDTGGVWPEESVPAENNEVNEPPTTEEQAIEPQDTGKTVIGKSVNGRDIVAYHFGTGAKEILFVGGAHGGCSWNTALLAYQLADYLKANPNEIPASLKITVIPVLNPDGLAKVVDKTGAFAANDVATPADASAARFNANGVDLNRNFDCEWKATGVWQNKTVSGGNAPFSEPESAAIRDYAKSHQLAAVVAWYSAAGGVFSSSCNNGVSPETQAITDVYAKASGYPAHKDFDFYEITGDMTNWFAKNNVPAIGVVLSTSDNPEWSKNWAGCKAFFEHYGK